MVQVIALMMAFVLVAGLGGVLSAGLLMPAVAATSGLTDTSVRLFDDLPSELEEVALSEKSFLLASDGTKLAEFYAQNRIVVPIEQISQAMQDAVIAVEDKRFYEHGGVDPAGMMRALFQKASSGRNEGASTLTQQYIKNMLIQQALAGEDPQQIAQAIQDAQVSKGTEGVARKLREAKMAISLEQQMTKTEILEGYLNIAQFGYEQIYGVEAAARHFFSVHASELNYLQAATIAGITQAPTDNDPVKNPEQAQERRDTVLRRMHDQKYITDEEYNAGIATPLADTLVISPADQTCMTANSVSNAGFFCDYVTKVILNNPAFGETREDRSRLLYRGGLTITTTLDRGLQAMADEEVKRTVPAGDPSGVGSAISVIQPGTGYILAMAQSSIYNTSKTPPPGQTAVNWNTDVAYGGATGFAPGSAFKPFTLAEWFKQGHALDEMVNGTERKRNENEFTACGAKGPNVEWNLGNSDGGRGVMTVLDATRGSVNNAYADMAARLDLCNIMQTAADLGIHQAGHPPRDGNFSAIPANVIGSESVAPMTMANAYAAFAAGGVVCDPIAIISIVDTDGKALDVPKANCRQALDPGVAAAVSFTLTHVWQGTGSKLGGIGRPAAGKTGTTSNNEHTWFVGYTPQMATAVWTGDPLGMVSHNGDIIGGVRYPHIYGATISGATWVRFMARAHEGREVAGFPAAPGNLVNGPKVQVPSVLGKSPDEARRILTEAGFNVKFDEYTRFDSRYPKGTVCIQTPGGGSRVAGGSIITLSVSAGPDPNVPANPGGGGPGGGGPGGGKP